MIEKEVLIATPEGDDYIIRQNNKFCRTLNSAETKLVTILFEMVEKDHFTFGELNKMMRFGNVKLLEKMRNWRIVAIEEAKEYNFFMLSEERKKLKKIFFSSIFISVLLLMVNYYIYLGILLLSIIGYIYSLLYSKKTKIGMQEYTNWKGFQKYLSNNESAIEDKHLAYAVILKIGKDKLKEKNLNRASMFDWDLNKPIAYGTSKNNAGIADLYKILRRR